MVQMSPHRRGLKGALFGSWIWSLPVNVGSGAGIRTFIVMLMSTPAGERPKLQQYHVLDRCDREVKG